ncbi:MAG: TIGR04283 family arsenosugar biosynthesis glycosyltransferase [Alphaproteobacteria bacterium]|nr:TIGR04283 family arsenosugar biosynthesis glycosyltransferase [Alphaproteobacteria bacterium]
MISVVIPTLDSEHDLTATLSALVPPTIAGVVREVIVVDGGSCDRTADIVEEAGGTWISCSPAGRGPQLAAGAENAKADWILFLHADTVLSAGWHTEVETFIRNVDAGTRADNAGVFRFQLDDDGVAPRLLESLVYGRTRWLKFPYGDQGLLISRRLYDEVGGFRPLQLMEDVDLVRRIGRRRIHAFRSAATTSAERYRRHGYLRRIGRNQVCLALYYLNVSPNRLAKVYSPAQSVKMRQT